MRRLLTATTLTVVCSLALALGVSAWASPERGQAACGTFAGPAWTWSNPVTGTAKRGRMWTVTARRAPCAFAKTTAKTLVRTPFMGEVTRFKSPKGWSCMADGAMNAGGRGTPGHCRQGSKFFQWRPALKS